MSHFTVLTAVQLPQEMSDELKTVPEQEIEKRCAFYAYIGSLYAKQEEHMPAPEFPPINDQMRMELFVENLIWPLLAPYDENTRDPRYVEFADCTEDCRNEYEEGVLDCVRMPDGRTIPAYLSEFSRNFELHEGQVYQRRAGRLHQRKRTKKAKKIKAMPGYPYFRKNFSSLEELAEQYHGFVRNEETGAYGFYCNPEAKWDWYQVGGRWPDRFLVSKDCPVIMRGERSFLLDKEPGVNVPEGCQWVAGARKCDIAWDQMKSYMLEVETKRWQKLVEWFRSGEIPNDVHALRIIDDGIESWGNMVYYKDESLEEYILRKGLSDQFKYSFSTFAFVGPDGWRNHAKMGWFGTSQNEMSDHAWNQMVENFIAGLPDETLLVSVDCHI